MHHYPMHALVTQSSLLPSPEQDAKTADLTAFAEAHSRVVLLLQSLAHSSSRLPSPEPKEPTAPSRTYISPSIRHPRELTFPAPLSYQSSISPASTPSRPPSPQTAIDPMMRPNQDSGHARAASSPRPSPKKGKASFDTLGRQKSRLSFFGGSSYSKAAPPPPVDPKTLRMYSSSWRRTLFHTSGGQASDDEDGSSRNHGRFSSSPGVYSMESGSSSGGGNFRDSQLFRRQPSPNPQPSFYGPHDVMLATSRVRAPVLRVFYPCTDLSEDSAALQQCEEQLMEAGLWEHLSTGDIVVNLGYIPPSEESSDESMGPPSKLWLLFNGEVLIPYTPPEQMLPLPNPLSLPSPFYYSHLTPSNTSPVYRLPRFPKVDEVPQLTLVHVSTKIPSPRSPEGFVLVKRYCWTARVYVHGGIGLGTDEALGLGWLGEWVLQGDGTKEGRKVLLNCLRGHDTGHNGAGFRWELVRDKSGGGRIWFRWVLFLFFLRVDD